MSLFFSAELGVHSQDVESALAYSLRQEIASYHTIEGEKLQALRDYVEVLAKVSTEEQ